jgi:hypothetical protein
MAKGNTSGLSQDDIRRQVKANQRRGLGGKKKSTKSQNEPTLFQAIKLDQKQEREAKREQQIAETGKCFFDHWMDTARVQGSCVIDRFHTREFEKGLEMLKEYLQVAKQFQLLPGVNTLALVQSQVNITVKSENQSKAG